MHHGAQMTGLNQKPVFLSSWPGYFLFFLLTMYLYTILTFIIVNGRLVSSGKIGSDDSCSTFSFQIRCGTSKGICNRIFRAECSRDLASWSRALVQGTQRWLKSNRSLYFTKYISCINWRLSQCCKFCTRGSLGYLVKFHLSLNKCFKGF